MTDVGTGSAESQDNTDVASRADAPSTFSILLIFRLADDKGIGGTGLSQVVSKPKPRPVLKKKDTEKNSGTSDKELEDDNPFSVLFLRHHAELMFLL
jgi:hypothetical protein